MLMPNTPALVFRFGGVVRGRASGVNGTSANKYQTLKHNVVPSISAELAVCRSVCWSAPGWMNGSSNHDQAMRCVMYIVYTVQPCQLLLVCVPAGAIVDDNAVCQIAF